MPSKNNQLSPNTVIIASMLLRLGLAFVFSYAAIGTFIDPDHLLHFAPSFVSQIVPQNIFMYMFATFEVALSLWLLSGKWTIVPALLAAATMAGIIVFNGEAFSVLFRNVSIMLSSLALVALHWPARVHEVVPQPHVAPSPAPAVAPVAASAQS
jgi:uncharacterized membrane protein YphA (DoxX/SURF4 family)